MLISSDTNIWLDFECIGHTEHPFLLDHKYYLSDITYHDELNQSKVIRGIVEQKKLLITNVSLKEMLMANEFSDRYPKISFQDSLALAIAKNRNWILLSGDGALRAAAQNEGIPYRGTLWIYDELTAQGKLSKEELLKTMENLFIAVENGRRLPKEEIRKRIEKLRLELQGETRDKDRKAER